MLNICEIYLLDLSFSVRDHSPISPNYYSWLFDYIPISSQRIIVVLFRQPQSATLPHQIIPISLIALASYLTPDFSFSFLIHYTYRQRVKLNRKASCANCSSMRSCANYSLTLDTPGKIHPKCIMRSKIYFSSLPHHYVRPFSPIQNSAPSQHWHE